MTKDIVQIAKEDVDIINAIKALESRSLACHPHNTTIVSLLEELEEYMGNKSDCDMVGEDYQCNDENRLEAEIHSLLFSLKRALGMKVEA